MVTMVSLWNVHCVLRWVLTTAATIARFTALADRHGLVFGELLARALDAFEARN
jgi:hypothetical protein